MIGHSANNKIRIPYVTVPRSGLCHRIADREQRPSRPLAVRSAAWWSARTEAGPHAKPKGRVRTITAAGAPERWPRCVHDVCHQRPIPPGTYRAALPPSSREHEPPPTYFRPLFKTPMAALTAVRDARD
jgi:hypothetical protein